MVKILFFARLKEQLGLSSTELEWDSGGTIATLANQLVADNGEAWQVLLDEETVYAINQQIVDRDAIVNANDEVAFFPPVTGG